ncbi:hypothetical protein JCM11641_006280 [Rhodosporidiobolus odoratus]
MARLHPSGLAGLPAPPPGPALAHTPLLSFLVHTPQPSLVLPLSPLLDALNQRNKPSSSRIPPWNTATAQPPSSYEAAEHGPAAQGNRADRGGEAGDGKAIDFAETPAALLGGLEHLNVRTPLGSTIEASATRPGDYFSLGTAPTGPDFGSSSSSVSSTSTSRATDTSSADPIHTPLTPLDDDPDAFEKALQALKPVYRNEAWRSLEAGTRRNSAAPSRHSQQQEKPAGVARATTRNRNQQEEDFLLGGISAQQSRAESFGSGAGSRGASPALHTVEEEQYEMDTDDGGSGLGSLVDDEPWQGSYGFLTDDEQSTLLHFVLDCLKENDVVAALLPRQSSTSSANPGVGGTYYSPTSVSPTSTVSFASTISREGSDGAAPQRWSPDGVASSSFSNNHAHPPRQETYKPSPPPQQRTPNVIRINNSVITATIVPVPPGAHPPTGFVVLTAPPPSPALPPPPATWLPSRLPVRSNLDRTSSSLSTATATAASSPSTSSSVSTPALNTRATSEPAPTPSALTEASATALQAFKSPTQTSTFLPSLPRMFVESHEDEMLNPYLKALGESEMARRIREFDWSKTALGPISSWPRELKTMVASILASPFRECILWGESMTIIYNDLYIETAGVKHPGLLGLPAREGWAEIWDGLNSVAQRTLKGETCFFRDHYLAMARKTTGYTEETYHTFSYAPFYSGEGEVLGILNLSIETSATVIAARRLATVRDLIQMTSLARTVEDFAASALESLSTNAYDLPFVLLYTAEEVCARPTKREVRAGYDRSTRTSINLTCRGSSGIPQDHPFLIQEALIDITPHMSRQSSSSASTSTGTGSTATAMDLRERLEAGAFSPANAGSPTPSTSSSASTTGPFLRHGTRQAAWSWPFEEACLKRDPVVVEDLGLFAEGLDRSRGWNTPAKQAVVIPIMVEAGQKVPSAVLVLGVNPQNRYDQLMETFFSLLSRHVAIGLFAVVAAEQDRLRAEELVKLDRAKSNFFSSVSHELRTPLTLILGPLDDLLNGSDKDKINKPEREKLILVNRHANRLLAMVNKLLDFSSVENGRMTFKYRPARIGPLTRDIAVLFRDAIQRVRIDFTVDCDEDPSDCLPVYLAADIWEKVIYNLVGNALKYTAKGSIRVSLRSTRAEAVLAVEDTGIGIPQAELGKVFDRFHRTENSRMATGTGIGLALTLELVKLLGGQLEVESEVGQGSTFRVRLNRGHTHLPIEQVDHTPEDEVKFFPNYQNRNLAAVDEAASWRYDVSLDEAMDSTPLSSASSSSSTGTTVSSDGRGDSSGSGSGEDYLGSADVLSLKNRTIVLVDDSRDLRSYMAGLLAKQFTVVQFGDPREALDYINRRPPSLLLTDSMMPHLSGMELTAALRRSAATALIPILMVSAQAGSEARAEALEGGCDDYLVKPFQARELVARVRVHLQLGLMRVELEKRVEERTRALIESEARNRALAERYSMLSTVSPVGVIEINNDGQMTYSNPRWHEISGAPVDRPLEEWKDTVVPEDWPKVERLWEMATKGGPAGETEERQFRFINGRWAQLEIRASADGGIPDGYVGALTDITSQKEVELLHIREVEQRAADAEQTRINTEMFLDMSSHELRNPLSGVWQNAELVAASLDKYVELLENLRDGSVPSSPELEALTEEMTENVDAVDSILLCAAHQGRIADDILNVSKLNMGLLTIQRSPFELVSRLREVLKVFEVECSQKSIALKLNADPSVERLRAGWVKADPSRLHQILLNFLTNSIKYTSDASTRRIVVHVQAFDSQPPIRPHALRVSQPPHVQLQDAVWIAIAVEDSGRGLSDEELRRLFARFSQANPKSDQYGGSGLGLYVSKKLVELHGGYIEVESQLGMGSIFSFCIPADRAAPPTSPVTRPPVSSLSMAPTARVKRPASAGGPEISKPANAKRPLTSPSMDSTKASKSSRMSVSPPPTPSVGTQRILVVEDNLINQKVLTRQLKIAGYEVQVANNGQEALDALAADNTVSATAPSNPFLFVFCDIEMPVMGGLEAIKEQRRREQSGEIPRRYPICALTGNARDQQIQTCLQAGFDDVATKPYRIDDLLTKIATLTGQAPTVAK